MNDTGKTEGVVFKKTKIGAYVELDGYSVNFVDGETSPFTLKVGKSLANVSHEHRDENWEKADEYIVGLMESDPAIADLESHKK